MKYFITAAFIMLGLQVLAQAPAQASCGKDTCPVAVSFDLETKRVVVRVEGKTAPLSNSLISPNVRMVYPCSALATEIGGEICSLAPLSVETHPAGRLTIADSLSIAAIQPNMAGKLGQLTLGQSNANKILVSLQTADYIGRLVDSYGTQNVWVSIK